MHRFTPILVIGLLFACDEEHATPSVPVEPLPVAPEQEVPETAAGPIGHAVTAHCGRMDPPVTVDQSRLVEVVIRELTSEITWSQTIETGAIGWLCLFDRFGPGEERVPRGPEHVQGLRLLWADPRTRELGERRGHEPAHYLIVPMEAVDPIWDFARNIVRSNPDPALCERALATPLIASDAARDAAMAVQLEMLDRSARHEAAILARAIDEILVDCGRRSTDPD